MNWTFEATGAFVNGQQFVRIKTGGTLVAKACCICEVRLRVAEHTTPAMISLRPSPSPVQRSPFLQLRFSDRFMYIFSIR
ncbi:hypothetical protein EVAR_78099_1 [Eumeta japonica]|uniref:Uncharacterized protein n=1 Tax=Eumeta variegata TaxID=151549 RepID=A0A4C1T322_EUMVA|nr:hypothetical protein EVAR_78099_1 [Eumeta japonica]